MMYSELLPGDMLINPWSDSWKCGLFITNVKSKYSFSNSVSYVEIIGYKNKFRINFIDSVNGEIELIVIRNGILYWKPKLRRSHHF